jgi:hypothetical protein
MNLPCGNTITGSLSKVNVVFIKEEHFQCLLFLLLKNDEQEKYVFNYQPENLTVFYTDSRKVNTS